MKREKITSKEQLSVEIKAMPDPYYGTDALFRLPASAGKSSISSYSAPYCIYAFRFAMPIIGRETDLRYIQSLLGHSSAKTTEIYTHITTKGFEQIKSPLDKLKIK